MSAGRRTCSLARSVEHAFHVNQRGSVGGRSRREGFMKVGIRSNTLPGYGLLIATSLPIVACGGLEGDSPEATAADEPVATVSQSLTGTWAALSNAPPANL